MRRLLLLALVLIFAGCAQIATVKTTTPQLAVMGNDAPEMAQNHLREAARVKDSNPLQALGYYLAAAHAAADDLRRHPADKRSRDLYNFSVARSIEVIEAGRLNPWDGSLKVPSPTGEYTLRNVRPPEPEYNPGLYELIPGDTIIIGGTYLDRRVTIDGIGAPVVAVGREQRKDFRKTFATRRAYANVTGIIRFNDHRAEIEFFLPLSTQRVSLGGRDYPLAADFTAAVFVGLARERPDKLGFARMVRPEKYVETARLTRLQMYDPNRIPVLFVYGIGGTPQDMRYFLNHFDRKRYQLWFFHYPSGTRLERVARAMAVGLNILRQRHGFTRCDVVAHSMGGLVARTSIDEAVRSAGFNFIPKFVSISTPWGGHDAAEVGIRRLKKPLPPWLDVAPKSQFLAKLYVTRLPQGTRHLLIYGSKKGGPFWLKGENDGVVTVQSETAPQIKNTASAVIYLPYGHVEILEQKKTLAETLRFLGSS